MTTVYACGELDVLDAVGKGWRDCGGDLFEGRGYGEIEGGWRVWEVWAICWLKMNECMTMCVTHLPLVFHQLIAEPYGTKSCLNNRYRPAKPRVRLLRSLSSTSICHTMPTPLHHYNVPIDMVTFKNPILKDAKLHSSSDILLVSIVRTECPSTHQHIVPP
jgi:hypothetical protein